MPYLFLFTVGPVQSFIAQARKTQDLYAGSRILSELIKAGIDAIGRNKIIFPFAYPSNNTEWGNLESLPNRFVAHVDIAKTDLEVLGQNIEQAVRDKWRNITNSTIVDTALKLTKLTLPFSHLSEQLNFHLDIHWIFQEWSGVDADYSKAFETIEQNLGGIKNIRPFIQFNNGTGEQGRKCSLDGERNIKFYRKSKKQENQTDIEIRNKFLFAQDNCILDYESRIHELAAGEGLSAVSFVKRFFNTKISFPSTSEIALLKTIADINTHCNQFYSRFKDNTQLLYEENLNAEYFEKQGKKTDNLPEYQIDLENIKNVLKEKSPNTKFVKYYAVIMFDGDSMGEWLTKANSPQEHNKFSELLIKFASEAKKYIDDGKGKTVYAGGDDFLGFINLECLLDVMIWLRNNFASMVADHVPFKNGTKRFTFSAGVCIAHYKEPLALVLNKTRAMEKKAKDWHKNKNSFAISVIKGSGEEHETFWRFENNSLENIQILVDALRQEVFSNTFIKTFQLEFERTFDKKAPRSFTPHNYDLLKIELKRLIKRSVNFSLTSLEKENFTDSLLKAIWTDLFTSSINPNTQLYNFFSLLNICDFLHRILPTQKIKNNG